MDRLVLNEEIHEVVFHDLVPSARKFVWIATADLKDLHLRRTARRFDSFLALFADLVAEGVEIRLIHAKEPGPRFRADFDRFPGLIHSDRFERVLCPRNHMKCVLVDGRRAFLGSPNLTGAGMGANVAMYWAAKDWATPPLATRKQGQDVKAMVLASPEWGFKGLPLLEPLRQPGLRSQVSFLIIYGDQLSSRKRDAQNLFRNLKKYHPDPPPDKVKELKDLFEVALPTKLQGTQLLVSDEFNLLPDILQFINLRVTEQNFPWMDRK